MTHKETKAIIRAYARERYGIDLSIHRKDYKTASGNTYASELVDECIEHLMDKLELIVDGDNNFVGGWYNSQIHKYQEFAGSRQYTLDQMGTNTTDLRNEFFR